MRTRWIGITGLVLLLTSVALGTVGPRLMPGAFWGAARPAMAGSGMMGPGMMSDMMGPMMGPGMMGGGMTGHGEIDPNQPFDRQFLDQMIPHHQQGVMMAQHMIADSPRSELRDLAQRIISTQQHEIDQMRGWRREWYNAQATPNRQEAMMEQMSRGGMMNRDAMRPMMGANSNVDRMFLEMMIPHHESAITMAEQALKQAEHPEVKTLAQTIITTQRAEITEMQGYLQRWYGSS